MRRHIFYLNRYYKNVKAIIWFKFLHVAIYESNFSVIYLD